MLRMQGPDMVGMIERVTVAPVRKRAKGLRSQGEELGSILVRKRLTFRSKREEDLMSSHPK